MMSQPATQSFARAYAPASVGNIGVGFDLLGHSIVGPRDVVTVHRIDTPEVHITRIRGQDASAPPLPLDARQNTAGGALISLRESLRLDFGFAVEIDKGIPLGSGLGGSAASAVAALVAANALLDTPLSRDDLYPHALQGEAIASGSMHGDNVAPMLLGGVVMATHDRMISLDVPHGLHCVVVHPEQILETRRARAVLTDPYPLSQIVSQTTCLGLFLVGMMRGDLGAIRAGLQDVIVEPRRASLIPGFHAVKNAAMAHDALGASISGAGPSVFAWFAEKSQAEAASAAMSQAFLTAGYKTQAYVSPVAGPRAELLP